MEVMPNLLAKRTFHPVMTKKLVEPGYREAPDSRDPMVIVFAKVCRSSFHTAMPRVHHSMVAEAVAAGLLVQDLETEFSTCCYGGYQPCLFLSLWLVMCCWVCVHSLLTPLFLSCLLLLLPMPGV
jgi:hypothetical protein